MRQDREDLSKQKQALSDARQNLKEELLELARVAKMASKSSHRLPEVATAWRAVLKAEETLDFAVLDVQTARGEDA